VILAGPAMVLVVGMTEHLPSSFWLARGKPGCDVDCHIRTGNYSDESFKREHKTLYGSLMLLPTFNLVLGSKVGRA
jgi:hypothetical protein